MTYTSQELARILTDTRLAAIKNKHIVSKPLEQTIAQNIDDAPPMAQLLHSLGGVEAILEFNAYFEIREQVQVYQAEHNVSGLTLSKFSANGIDLEYLDHDDQLLLMDGDRPILKEQASAVLDAFFAASFGYTFYLEQGDETLTPVTRDRIESLKQRATHAYLYHQSVAWAGDTGRFVDLDDPDEITIVINTDDPGSDQTRLYFVALHPDLDRNRR